MTGKGMSEQRSYKVSGKNDSQKYHPTTPSTEFYPAFCSPGFYQSPLTLSSPQQQFSFHTPQSSRSSPIFKTPSLDIGFEKKFSYGLNASPMNSVPRKMSLLDEDGRALYDANSYFSPTFPPGIEEVEDEEEVPLMTDFTQTTDYQEVPSVDKHTFLLTQNDFDLSTNMMEEAPKSSYMNNNNNSDSSMESRKTRFEPQLSEHMSTILPKDKEQLTIEDLLKEDPIFELDQEGNADNSTVANKLPDFGNSNGLSSLFAQPVENVEPFDGTFDGLGINLDLGDITHKNQSNCKDSAYETSSCHSSSSEEKQETTPKTFGNQAILHKNSWSGELPYLKPPPKRRIKKANSYAGVPSFNVANKPASNLKKEPSFSLSDCSNTFSVNNTKTYSFIIENETMGTDPKGKRKFLPKNADFSPMRSTSNVTDTRVTKPTASSHSLSHSSSSSTSSPKAFKNMKSGMVHFQLRLNKNRK